MAREHARIKLSIWDDDEFRLLTVDAQHLYFLLMSHPKLDYCGVTDWRPGKLAGFCATWTTDTVEMAARELSEHLYIVIDVETEEVLLRSFIRNDGILESPNIATAMRKAHAGLASAALRAIVVHELCRLHKDKPDLKGWPKASELLDRDSLNPSDYPSYNPSVNPSRNPSVSTSVQVESNPSGNPSPTTVPSPDPSPTPPSGTALKRGTRIDPDWKPTTADLEWQRNGGFSDLLSRRELPKFIDYWTAKAGKDAAKLDWSATWRNWLRNAAEREGTRPATKQARPAGWEFGMDR